MSLDLSIFQDAAPYLRMSEEKRMEIMARQIALAKTVGGPKPVWCPTPENPELQYTKGKVTESKEELKIEYRFFIEILILNCIFGLIYIFKHNFDYFMFDSEPFSILV